MALTANSELPFDTDHLKSVAEEFGLRLVVLYGSKTPNSWTPTFLARVNTKVCRPVSIPSSEALFPYECEHSGAVWITRYARPSGQPPAVQRAARVSPDQVRVAFGVGIPLKRGRSYITFDV